MKRQCSKCQTPAGEFDRVCHKCGHIFRNVTHHITQRPHQYHIIRDIIGLILIILLVYWAFHIYTPTSEEIVVNPPEVNVPPVTVPPSEITVTFPEEPQEEPQERDTRLDDIEEAYDNPY